MDDDLEPLVAPKRGRPPKEVMPTASQRPVHVSDLPGQEGSHVTTGVQATVQTPVAPVPRSVEEVIAEYRQQQVSGPPPEPPPQVLAYDPGSVSRETNGRSVTEMSETELEAELARRRGQAPPAAVVPQDIRLGDDRAAPQFTASPAAEAARIAQLGRSRLVEARQAQPHLNQEGDLIAAPRYGKDPRTWPSGDKQIGNPFAPPVHQDEGEPGYVEAEVILADGSKRVVKLPLDAVQTMVADEAPPEGSTLFRCLQDGTPGGGGYVPTGHPDFWAQRVPGVHIRCPVCGNRTVQEIE